ncbi:MAG TPA: polyprenyl synthetase family protein [Chlamydiales bacterium]|nr:polyprenyl synthetase family protein [Chlamydiales bacterium]
MFEKYKARVESALLQYIDGMGEKSPLRDACAYSLTNGGKRLRPILVLMIGEALGKNDVMPAALSVEFFHTASLIADDLPSMDNDAMRRGVPSLHVAFGETAAILASYTLMAAGYGGIHENGRIIGNDKRAMECLKYAVKCAGIQGATQGQYDDLFPPDLSLKTIQAIIYKKTVTLFEISFLFGWIFGGGDLSKIPLLKKSAYHLGMAFQIGDDLEDSLQDAGHIRGLNIAAALGRENAISHLEQEIASFEEKLKELSLWSSPFQALVKTLQKPLFVSNFCAVR